MLPLLLIKGKGAGQQLRPARAVHEMRGRKDFRYFVKYYP
jgi:hypothetical protein